MFGKFFRSSFEIWCRINSCLELVRIILETLNLSKDTRTFSIIIIPFTSSITLILLIPGHFANKISIFLPKGVLYLEQ